MKKRPFKIGDVVRLRTSSFQAMIIEMVDQKVYALYWMNTLPFDIREYREGIDTDHHFVLVGKKHQLSKEEMLTHPIMRVRQAAKEQT